VYSLVGSIPLQLSTAITICHIETILLPYHYNSTALQNTPLLNPSMYFKKFWTKMPSSSSSDSYLISPPSSLSKWKTTSCPPPILWPGPALPRLALLLAYRARATLRHGSRAETRRLGDQSSRAGGAPAGSATRGPARPPTSRQGGALARMWTWAWRGWW
jgi:hypothetical protein